MRSRRTLTALLALSFVAVLGPAVNVDPAQAATKYQTKTESYNVKTKYGDIYVEVARPVLPGNSKKVVKGPAILTYSPYSILWVALNGGRTYDAPRWVPRGYVRVWADVFGTGNSGGCWDYGGTAQKVQEHITPCQQLEHTQQGYSHTPDYGKFWTERDYLRQANSIHIPVLISANWGDWNVKQQESILMDQAIRHSKKKVLYMGNAWSGHGVPGGAYEKTVDAWMDHWLLGKDNGVQNLPS